MIRLTPEEFLAKIEESTVVLLTVNAMQEITLRILDDPETYLGPNPVSTGYVYYMLFLGKLDKVVDNPSFIRSYLLERLR